MPVGNIIRRDKGTDDVGGMIQGAFILPSAFAAAWPKEIHRDMANNPTRIIAGPTLKTGETFGNLVFDLDSGSMKGSRKGASGNTKHKHEGEMTFKGIENVTLNELDKTKEGSLILMIDDRGRRWLAGTSCRPLNVEYDVDFGKSAKTDIQKTMVKFNEEGYRHNLLEIDPSVVLPFLPSPVNLCV